MFRVAIVEDNLGDAELFFQMMKRYSTENGEQFNISHFQNPYDFLDECQSGFDLVVLDIELPFMNGMEAAKRMRKLDADVTLIFITNMAQYALHGYDVGAIDFILKPLDYYPFAMKLKKAIKYLRRFTNTVLTLKTLDGIARLSVPKIQYIEVKEHLLTYHTEDDTYIVRATMKQAEKELIPQHFLRCNSCYLVNLRHVKSVRNNLVMIADTALPISRSRRVEFLKGLTSYLGGSV